MRGAAAARARAGGPAAAAPESRRAGPGRGRGRAGRPATPDQAHPLPPAGRRDRAGALVVLVEQAGAAGPADADVHLQQLTKAAFGPVLRPRQVALVGDRAAAAQAAQLVLAQREPLADQLASVGVDDATGGVPDLHPRDRRAAQDALAHHAIEPLQRGGIAPQHARGDQRRRDAPPRQLRQVLGLGDGVRGGRPAHDHEPRRADDHHGQQAAEREPREQARQRRVPVGACAGIVGADRPAGRWRHGSWSSRPSAAGPAGPGRAAPGALPNFGAARAGGYRGHEGSRAACPGWAMTVTDEAATLRRLRSPAQWDDGPTTIVHGVTRIEAT